MPKQFLQCDARFFAGTPPLRYTWYLIYRDTPYVYKSYSHHTRYIFAHSSLTLTFVDSVHCLCTTAAVVYLHDIPGTHFVYVLIKHQCSSYSITSTRCADCCCVALAVVLPLLLPLLYTGVFYVRRKKRARLTRATSL